MPSHFEHQWIYGYLLFAWLVTATYNWFLIEKTIRGVQAKGPYIERSRLWFPYVATRHPSCPAELKRVYRSCMRWIYGPAAVLVALSFVLG